MSGDDVFDDYIDVPDTLCTGAADGVLRAAVREKCENLAVLLTPNRSVGQVLEAVQAPFQSGDVGTLATDKTLSNKHGTFLSVAGGVWFLPVRRLAMTLCLITPVRTQAKSIGHQREINAGAGPKIIGHQTGTEKIFVRHQTHLFSIAQHIYLVLDRAALPC